MPPLAIPTDSGSSNVLTLSNVAAAVLVSNSKLVLSDKSPLVSFAILNAVLVYVLYSNYNLLTKSENALASSFELKYRYLFALSVASKKSVYARVVISETLESLNVLPTDISV